MNQTEKAEAIQKATTLGAVVNVLLSALQLVMGILFHSNALIMDAIHSLSDLFTDVFVFIMTKVGRAGPDENHPYGHGRFETMGVVVLGSTLIAVAVLLGWQNIERLMSGAELAAPSGWALAAPIAAILSKEVLFRYTLSVGKKANAKIIIANAWHHRSDAMSSIVVLIGVGLASMGLPWMDSVAAIAVAVFIAKVGADFVYDSVKELVDTALEPELVSEIENEFVNFPGVKGVHNLKTRRVGDAALVDVNIEVDSKISVSEGHEIAARSAKKVVNKFEDVVDVTVHTDIEHDHKEGQYFIDPDLKAKTPVRHEVEGEVEQTLKKHGLCDDFYRMQIHYINKEIHLDLYFKNTQTSEKCNSFKKDILSYDWVKEVEMFAKIDKES